MSVSFCPLLCSTQLFHQLSPSKLFAHFPTFVHKLRAREKTDYVPPEVGQVRSFIVRLFEVSNLYARCIPLCAWVGRNNKYILNAHETAQTVLGRARGSAA